MITDERWKLKEEHGLTRFSRKSRRAAEEAGLGGYPLDSLKDCLKHLEHGFVLGAASFFLQPDESLKVQHVNLKIVQLENVRFPFQLRIASVCANRAQDIERAKLGR